MKKQKFTVDNRINGQIKASQVRITGEGIESKIVSLGDALALAGDMSLDLVEISPNANPPVCRICDFGKFLYEKKIQDKLNKKNRTELKEVQLFIKRDDMIHLTFIALCDGSKLARNGSVRSLFANSECKS